MSEGYLQLPKDLSAVPLPTQLLSNEQTTQIKVAKLNAGTFYAFQLSARNACGETVSSVQWFQTQASTPAAPQPPRCTTASNTSLSLSWDALPESACNGSAVDSYVLQVSESGEWRVAHNDASTSLWLAHGVMSSAVLRGLRPNTTYAFRLCAHNAEGNSAFSTPVSFISFYSAHAPIPSPHATVLGVPPAPAFLPAQMAKRHTSDSLFLRYEPDEAFAAAIDAYRITVLRDQDVVAQVETPELTYRVQNLLPGTSYTLFLLLSLIVASSSKRTPPSGGVSLLLSSSPRFPPRLS